MKLLCFGSTLLPYVWLTHAFLTSTRMPPLTVTVFLLIACAVYHVAFLREARRGFTVPLVTYYFFWIFMGIAPLACSLTGRWLWGDITFEYTNEILWGCFYCLVFLSTFVFAFKQAQRRPAQGWIARAVVMRHNGLAYATVVALGIWLYIISRIGFEGLLSRAGGEALFEDSATELLVIFNFLRPLGLFLCILPAITLICFRDPFVRPKWLALALAALGLGLNLPFSVPRYYALMTLGVIIYFILRQHRLRVSRYLGAFFLVMGFFGSFLVNTFRSAASGAEVFERFGELQAVQTDHFYYGDLDAYEMLTYGIAYVGDNKISWGREALGAGFFWVPRSIWRQKPVSTGQLLASSYINTIGSTANVNVSAPLVLEGLINFGILGIVAFAGLSGWILGRLTNASFCRGGFTRSDAVLAALTGLWLFILRGSLMSAFAYASGIGLAALCAVLLLYRRKI